MMAACGNEFSGSERMRRAMLRWRWVPVALVGALIAGRGGERGGAAEQPGDGRFLYVAAPGIRNYLEYGGHGLLVFDIDRGHRFVKRIAAAGLDEAGKPVNVKGVCASAATGRIYVSTTRTLTCLDLVTEKILWERTYEGGCDRMAIRRDGRVIYLPSYEKEHWHVVDAMTGDVIRKIVTGAGAHNTACDSSGRYAFFAGLRSPIMTVLETQSHSVVKKV